MTSRFLPPALPFVRVSASAAFLLLVNAFAGAETANLLENGSFEKGSERELPPGWTTYVPHGSAVLQLASDRPHGGTRSCTVQTTSDLTACIISDPPLPVAPGEELSFEVWGRAEDLSTSSGGRVSCTVGFIDAKGRTFDWNRTELEPPSSGEWFPVRKTVPVPPRAVAATLQLGLRKMTGRTWWDDAELRAVRPQVARLAPPEKDWLPGETTVPLVVINRDPAARGKEVVVRMEPGDRETRHALTADPVSTVPVTVSIGKRGKVSLSAQLSTGGGSAEAFSTSHTITVKPLLEAEPPLPTHFVLEEGRPRFEQRLEIHDTAEARREMSLRCVLRDSSGTVVADHATSSLPPNPVSFEMALPESRPAVPGDYTAELQILRGDTVLASETQDWHVIRRAQAQTGLGENGYLLVDGKPFFPLGIYMATTQLDELAEAGFNTVQSYPAFAGPESNNQSAKSFLDRAQEHGLKVLTFISHGPDRLNEEDSLRRIRMFRNHPASLVWYQEEAVDRGYKPLSWLKNLYDTLKREAPEHPVGQGDRRDTAARMAGRTDIFPEEAMDFGVWWWYPTPLRSTPNTEGYEGEPTGEELEYVPPVFLTEATTKKPLWVALQCYKKPGVPDARFPTPAEYRAQAYIAICHGAKGLLYYTFTGERGHGIHHRREEGHWPELKKIVGELRDMSPVFMAPDGAEPVSLSPGNALVSTRLKDLEGRRVLLAVNRSIRPVEVTFQVPGLKGGEVRVRGEGRTVKAGAEGALTDSFDSYAVHVYELPPSGGEVVAGE